MRNTEYKTERKPTWRQPRLGRQVLDLLSCLPSPLNFDLTATVVSKKSPLTIQGSGWSLSQRETVGKGNVHSVVALRASKRGCGWVGFLELVPHFPLLRALSPTTFLRLLIFLSFFPPCSVRFPDHASRKPQEGRRPSSSSGKQATAGVPASRTPRTVRVGGHLFPGTRPVFLSQTVLTTGPGRPFSAEPHAPGLECAAILAP